MNEEMTNVAVDCVEGMVEGSEVTEVVAKTGGKHLVGKLCLTGALICGAAIIVNKNKDKIYKWMARKLEKNGYLVTEAPVIDTDEDDESIDELFRSED